MCQIVEFPLVQRLRYDQYPSFRLIALNEIKRKLYRADKNYQPPDEMTIHLAFKELDRNTQWVQSASFDQPEPPNAA